MNIETSVAGEIQELTMSEAELVSGGVWWDLRSLILGWAFGEAVDWFINGGYSSWAEDATRAAHKRGAALLEAHTF